MLNLQSGHLTFREIASLLERRELIPERTAAHAAECAECAQMVESLGKLIKTSYVGSASNPRECLGAAEIALLASGSSGVEGQAWMEHVLNCDACGSELLHAMEIFGTNLRPEEEEEMVRLLSAPPHSSGAVLRMPRARPTWRIWGAVAAVLLLAAGGGLWYAAEVRNAPERLLAVAYTRQRLVDFRLPDAGYTPVTRTRGSGDGVPSELLLAEAELTAKIETGGENPRTLALLAVANLQSLRPDAAVERLERARKLNPKSAETLAELGAAYGLRGEMEQRTEDYARALEYLGQALQAAPNSLVALFNRALVLERLNLLEDAATAWGEYLARDSASRWAKEARERQAAVQARIKSHAMRWEMLSRGPEALLDAKAREISPDLFLEAAIFRWLSAPVTEAERNAIRQLGEVLAERHKDEWLRKSLLEAPPGSALWEKMRAAVDANLAGNPEAARLARDARAASLASHAVTFAMRADFEEIYALDRTQQSQACLQLASDALKRLTYSEMAWLNSAIRSEEANCLVMSGEEAGANKVLAEAVELSASAGLLGQEMRARGLRIGVNTNVGNPWFTFAEAPDYLARYWTDGLRPNRLHQVSFNLATASQFMGYMNAACTFGEAAVRAISESGDRRAEALTRVRLSAMALAAGRTDLAKREAALAANFFANDSDPRTAAFRQDVALTAAAADLAEENYTALKSRLHSFEGRPAALATYFLDLRLRRLEAAAAMHDGDWQAADRALARAMGEIQKRLRSVSDPKEKIALFEQAAPLYRMRTEAYLDQGQPDRALESAIELFSMTGADERVAVARPQPRDTWLIYVCLPKRVAVWVVTAKGREFYWAKGTRGELALRIEKFKNLAGTSRTDPQALLRESKELFSNLVPLRPELIVEGRRLVIVPDGEIAMVPFLALSGPDGRLLGLTIELLRTHRLPPQDVPAGLGRPGLLLVAGAAVQQPGLTLPPLAEAATEARYVAGNEPIPSLAGSALTAEALAAAAPSASWVHFVGHGYSNGGNGALFVGGSEKPLTSPQILKMDWSRCRLAVLSACWTASGEGRAFANPESLVQAFLTAGASGVVAPAWTIDSIAASLWMREFYAAMRRGAEPPAAIRAASRSLASQQQFEKPYYWASFEYFI